MENINFLAIVSNDRKDSQLDCNQTRRHSFKLNYHITNSRQLVITIQMKGNGKSKEGRFAVLWEGPYARNRKTKGRGEH
jgi:hypothetical protein